VRVVALVAVYQTEMTNEMRDGWAAGPQAITLTVFRGSLCTGSSVPANRLISFQLDSDKVVGVRICDAQNRRVISYYLTSAFSHAHGIKHFT